MKIVLLPLLSIVLWSMVTFFGPAPITANRAGAGFDVVPHDVETS